MIEFKKGIIKGKITNGILEIITENPNLSNEIHILELNEVEEFLDKNDYTFTKSDKTKTINFSKCFIENRLKDYLNEHGISQSHLARKLGVGRTSINNLCNAKNLELETAYKITAALRLTPEKVVIIFPPKNLEMLF
ncbi:helix-turn-helix transcriptional regulator [Alkaliphilus sp. B6464]|uniref:helix-turn-helix transcriptional regulator n=1 Tax=Alkaliphilus sp. B6464 TaxID=2731219 RepID=UPI001BA79567|nr:helix-turn-helix transcriptional regulator [Alkaliphilus sp. B6464]QUH22056.1 helix-turn-helix transcriptional regulator [Alkaliphilus sp. B6464]